MLETVAVPMLFQAVDWLFGEVSKILDDRRQRQNAMRVDATSEPAGRARAARHEPAAVAQPGDAIQTREAALQHPVAEVAWQNAESHVQHLLSLLKIHTKNYHNAKEQYAKWGSVLVPSIIVHTMEEAETEIIKTTKELQSTLSLVYRKKVTNPELEQA